MTAEPASTAGVFQPLSKVTPTPTRNDIDLILDMRKGDVLPLNIPEHIVAKVDGVPVMECGYGVLNGNYALKVEKLLATSEQQLSGKLGE